MDFLSVSMWSLPWVSSCSSAPSVEREGYVNSTSPKGRFPRPWSSHVDPQYALLRPFVELLHDETAHDLSEGLYRYMRTSRQRPKALPDSVWGWILPTFQCKQDEVVAMAGYDAAMYLRILAFGMILLICLLD